MFWDLGQDIKTTSEKSWMLHHMNETHLLRIIGNHAQSTEVDVTANQATGIFLFLRKNFRIKEGLKMTVLLRRHSWFSFRRHLEQCCLCCVCSLRCPNSACCLGHYLPDQKWIQSTIVGFSLQ